MTVVPRQTDGVDGSEEGGKNKKKQKQNVNTKHILCERFALAIGQNGP